MNWTIRHDIELGMWISDLRSQIDASRASTKKHEWNRSVRLRFERPGSIWAAVRTAHPEFMSAIEHLQLRGIPIRLETAERLIALLIENAAAETVAS